MENACFWLNFITSIKFLSEPQGFLVDRIWIFPSHHCNIIECLAYCIPCCNSHGHLDIPLTECINSLWVYIYKWCGPSMPKFWRTFIHFTTVAKPLYVPWPLFCLFFTLESVVSHYHSDAVILMGFEWYSSLSLWFAFPWWLLISITCSYTC